MCLCRGLVYTDILFCEFRLTESDIQVILFEAHSVRPFTPACRVWLTNVSTSIGQDNGFNMVHQGVAWTIHATLSQTGV